MVAAAAASLALTPAATAAVNVSMSGGTATVDAGDLTGTNGYIALNTLFSRGTGQPSLTVTAVEPNAVELVPGAGCEVPDDLPDAVRCDDVTAVDYLGSAQAEYVAWEVTVPGTVDLGEGADALSVYSASPTGTAFDGGNAIDTRFDRIEVLHGQVTADLATGQVTRHATGFYEEINFSTARLPLLAELGSQVTGSPGPDRVTLVDDEAGCPGCVAPNSVVELGAGNDLVQYTPEAGGEDTIDLGEGVDDYLFLSTARSNGAFGPGGRELELDTAADELRDTAGEESVKEAAVRGVEHFFGEAYVGLDGSNTERVVDPAGELKAIGLFAGDDAVAAANDVAQRIDCGAGEDTVESADPDDELIACEAGPQPIVVNDSGDGPDTDAADGDCDADDAAEGEQCTLRAALAEAAAQEGPETIEFDVDPAETIAPATPLPEVAAGTAIDASTQPGDPLAVNGPAEVLLDGAGAGEDAAGLRLAGARAQVRGLRISGFDGPGIEVTGPDAVIAANALTQNAAGIEVAAAGARIGGQDAADRNFIWMNGASDELAESAPGALPAGATDAQIRAQLLELGAGVLMTSGDAQDVEISRNALGFAPTGATELSSSVGVLVAPVEATRPGSRSATTRSPATSSACSRCRCRAPSATRSPSS